MKRPAKVAYWLCALFAAACGIVALICVWGPVFFRDGTARIRSGYAENRFEIGSVRGKGGLRRWVEFRYVFEISDNRGAHVAYVSSGYVPKGEIEAVKYLPFFPAVFVPASGYIYRTFFWVGASIFVVGTVPFLVARRYVKNGQDPRSVTKVQPRAF